MKVSDLLKKLAISIRNDGDATVLLLKNVRDKDGCVTRGEMITPIGIYTEMYPGRIVLTYDDKKEENNG